MKKMTVFFVGLLLVSGVFAAGNEMSFGINFGFMTDQSFSFDPVYWTAGVELDLQFGNYIMFSPEVILVGSGFEFKDFFFFPAAILNFTASNFFIGGGLTKGFYLGSGTATEITDVALKLNAGFTSKNLKLTAYAITAFNNLFNDMILGASFGFKF